jgi:hypothetical protein
MEEYISFDSHKHYTWVEHEQVGMGKIRQYRLEHAPGAVHKALAGSEPGTTVALEATANWYWSGRNRAGGTEVASAGASPQGEADDGADQQNR